MTKANEQPQQPATDDAEQHIETAVLPDGATRDSGADQAEHGDDGSNDTDDSLARARAEAEANWNQYLRAVAELDNARKRAARDVERARNYGIEGLAGDLLSVADSLEMGLEAAENATIEALVEGKQATLKQLQSAMERHGITSLYPVGEPFDPEFHEAISMQPSDTAEPDSVLTVVQRGYLLNGRLLRPARVVVSKTPD